MARISVRAPRFRRLPRAFWGGVIGAAATAVAVEITRTGLDILVLVVLGLAVILVERTVGDWLGELLGSGLATVVLGTCLTAIAWVVFEEGGAADQFFAAAEQRGYRTTYYQPSGQPPPAAKTAPAVAVASTGAGPEPSPDRTSRAGPTSSRSSVASGPLAGQSPEESAPSNSGNSNPVTLLLGSRLPTSKLILRVPTPAMTSEKITIRARLTADGRPVANVPIDFTANTRPIATATTDPDGVAVATFSAEIAGRYNINALFRNDGRFTQSSASALVIVLQGRD